MRDRLHSFGANTDVVLVTFTEPDHLTAYRERHGVDLPVILDPNRDAYRAFGLGRGSVRRVWGLQAARRYTEIIRSEGFAGLTRPTEDTLQLGGDFIVDPTGTLIYGFWGQGPDDRPDVDDLVAALDESTGP